MLKDDALATRIEDDFETAGLDERRLALLRFARRLTVRPASIDHDAVRSLRAVGLSDRDVLHLVEVVAYYAYANRIADGLGVRLEDEG